MKLYRARRVGKGGMLFRKTMMGVAGVAFLTLMAALPNAHSDREGVKPAQTGAKPVSAGEKVFSQQCAPCHGAKGEGTAAYPRALAGNQSVGQLTKYIANAMPPGARHLPLADARKVAPFLFDAFYSPLAQERNRPARISLSRLTVPQLRNAVADVIGSFRSQNAPGKAGGLQAEYFKARNFDDKERLIQRIDPEVSFDFKTSAPTGGEFDPHQFSIRWNGSVVAPDTGVYEFVVRCDHGFALWVNDDIAPLIENRVKSGKDTEFRGSLFLLGGRAYPLRLEFTKSTQGVDDSDKKKGKPAPPAFVSLSWKRPKQAEEILPARCLTPSPVSEVFVLNAPFPPDDRSMGYERGDSVSLEWDEATTATALETADYVVKHRKEFTGTNDDRAKLQEFCRQFVERALRRPLDKETEQRYVTKQFALAPNVETAMKRVVLLTMQSPRFLYREMGVSSNAQSNGKTPADPYNTASRLSFALWDTIPDPALLKAAASGELVTREQIAKQAERMASDARAWPKQRAFFFQWLKLDQYPDLAKDLKRFPDFSPSAATDLRTSLDLTLQNVVRSEKSDFRDLLLSDKVYLNGRLAKLYGVSLPGDAPFQLVDLDPAARAGVLTHPYFLAGFAYRATSSPIHRGVVLTRSVMGRVLPPPPAAFTPLEASLHPNLTTRQRVSLQTKPLGCQSCHSTINALGFTLERFDAIGRLRDTENNQPINATGSYESKAGLTVKFSGAQDLARYVADSDEAQSAFVEKLFQYVVKQPIRGYGPQTLPNLKHDFKQTGYNINRLTAQIAVTATLPPAKQITLR